MTLLTLDDVSLAYGHHPLLTQVKLQVSTGERVCLVGRNGAGKSTLFRVISGLEQPDHGEIWRKDTLRISHLLQEAPPDTPGTVYETVAAGLGEPGRLLSEYHDALRSADLSLSRLSDLQHRLDVLDGWNIERKVDTVLSRLSLEPDVRVSECSGGIRRRVMLAQALVSEPDLLLLDEPTNHMDIAAIQWLEEFLLSFHGALIFITHDRTLLRRLATRIIELDRGTLRSFPGDYEAYLRRKESLLETEARANAKLDKQLAEHEAWIRQGIKARRTRNEGRVRRLQAMRLERARRVAPAGRIALEVDDSALSGKLVVDLRKVRFSYGGDCIIRDFSTRIMRGDRVGIMGPNGCGKSTLLRLLVGELEPESGHVVKGTKLQIAYFDQQRDRLEPEKTVRENISEGSDRVTVRGRSRHVVGYLKDFLFPPERIDAPVKILSGGERNRLLLARIFTRPANMLVLDEPTNDLDVDTLELLEDLLADYDGTLLLVSHDRTFLDRVVTSTIVFEGDGRMAEYVGGYEDWLRQRTAPASVATTRKETEPALRARHKGPQPKLKLAYHEQRELEALPDKIERLEREQAELQTRIGDSGFYQQERTVITAAIARLDEIEEALSRAYERWEYLDSF